MSLTVFTVTIGREHYLSRQLDLLLAHKRLFDKHILVANGCSLPVHIRWKLRQLGSEVIPVSSLISIGDVLERYKGIFRRTSHVLKLDDDALPVGGDFFRHANELIRLIPDRVFSPYPVGLIQNAGGPKGTGHEVIRSKRTDTYYTLRKVNHVGGFARFSPSAYYADVRFDPTEHNEDVLFSKAMCARGVTMNYLENALIVEHAESTMGQLARDAGYFRRPRLWKATAPA